LSSWLRVGAIAHSLFDDFTPLMHALNYIALGVFQTNLARMGRGFF